MDVPPRAITAAKVTAAVVVVLAVLLGGLVATGVLAQPTVQHIDKGWGTVTHNTTEIETQVSVHNPNPIGIPGMLSVTYKASLNDVVLTRKHKSGIGLGPGDNTIHLSSTMPNDRIADWWVTHVNNDEHSTLRIQPKVSGPGFSHSLPARTSPIETDLLSSFSSGGRERITVDNETLLFLSNESAAWGHADAETTPLSFEATVENRHDYPVTLDGVAYDVSMNNVTLGQGQTTDGLHVQPGESGTLTVDAALDTQAFADWWPTHVRNDETSRMSVELYGIVDRNGTRTRVPIRLYHKRLAFDTHLLGSGGTSVKSLPSERDSVTVPTVAETDRHWGTITDSTADVVTTVHLQNTSDLSKLRDVTRLTLDRSTTIDGVTVIDNTTERGLPEAGEPLTVTSGMDNGKFTDWWPKHVNGGESSTVHTQERALVDVGITTFERPLSDTRTNFETNILGEIGADGPQRVTVANETLAVLRDQQASWGHADAETTPFRLSTTVENRHDRPLTFDGVAYNVTMNDVTVANGTSDRTLTVAPSGTGTLDVTVPMSTPKLSAWWVTHLRNGERSNVSVELYGLVERGGDRERVPIALAKDRFRLTTDLLGDGSSSVESLPTRRADVSRPTVAGTHRRWGQVTDATTAVVTNVTVDNPNTDPAVNDFLRLDTTSTTRVNGVFFGSGQRSGMTLTAGTNVRTLTSDLDNDAVPAWWAKHLNDGEVSTTNTTTSTTVDVGFTTIDVPTPDENSTFRTNMLADLNTQQDQPIEQDGRTYLVAKSTSAEWGHATPQEAPLHARSVVYNQQPAPVTVERIDYTVSINGITLADASQYEGTIVGPGETKPIALTMTLDNSKMDQWWVTHVRNGERSHLTVDATATISVGGRTRTVPLDMFSQNETIETDVLGRNST